MHSTTFDNTELHIIESQEHDFLLANKEVAAGYEIRPNQLTQAKTNHSDELIEGKHWVRLKVQTGGGKQSVIHWTKRGIIRLGFFIKSERARRFRDWIEDLTINHVENVITHELESSLKQREDYIYLLKREITELKRAVNRGEKNAKSLLAPDALIHNSILDLVGRIGRQIDAADKAAAAMMEENKRTYDMALNFIKLFPNHEDLHKQLHRESDLLTCGWPYKPYYRQKK